MYPDAYAHIYQKMEGFKIKIYAPENKFFDGYLSLEPSTRSTYDIAMRDATINGLLTMDNIEDLKSGQLFYKDNNPNELYIIQSVNKLEQQKNTKNIAAIKQNSYITVQRKQYNDETSQEEYMNIYEDIVSFVSIQNKDEKNFAAGIEDNTIINIQIPKRDVENTLRIINNQDRLILSDIDKEMTRKVKVESVDEFGVPGVIRIYGTYETRTGE